jgi:glutamine synthetase
MTSPALPPDLESVSVCVPDHYGRLAGKRIAAHRFGEILAGGLDMPDFHLVTGPDNQPAAGVAATGDHTGFPNDVLWPDMETFRRLPWDPDTGIVLAQARRRDGSVIAEAPRAILQHQAERLASHGLSAWVATELEFYVYEDSYAQSFRKGYRGLSPLYHRNGDNDVLVTEFLDGYLRPLRRAMAEVGLPAEATQGEGGVGQVEMNFPADAPLRAADAHALFKHAAKAIAYRHDRCVTFMAQPDQDQAASGCHLHLSLRDQAGLPCTAAPGTGAPDSPGPGSPGPGSPGPGSPGPGTELSERARRFLAGLLAFSPELTLLHAPVVNSYRRLQPGGWAPAAATWGHDDRRTMVRVVGSGASLRLEFRLPGADANPYLAIAAALAAGIAGLETLETEAALPVDLRTAAARGGDQDPGAALAPGRTAPPIPMDLTEAIQRFEESKLAGQAFGEDIRAHVAGMARHELRLARRAVTDWELGRGFETA